MAKTKATKPTKINLPPYPVLRAALVARVEKESHPMQVDLHRVARRFGLSSTDAVRKAASKALTLYCGKTCWFCNSIRPKALKVGAEIDWATIPLCACLADERQGVVWHEVRDAEGAFTADLGTGALNRIRKAVARRSSEPGYLPAETPVVSRCCDAPRDGKLCGARFTLTAGMYKSAADSTVGQAAARDAKQGLARTELERLGDFKHPTKCRECRDAWRDRAATLRPRKEVSFAEMVLATGLLKEVL